MLFNISRLPGLWIIKKTHILIQSDLLLSNFNNWAADGSKPCWRAQQWQLVNAGIWKHNLLINKPTSWPLRHHCNPYISVHCGFYLGMIPYALRHSLLCNSEFVIVITPKLITHWFICLYGSITFIIWFSLNFYFDPFSLFPVLYCH